MIYNVAQLLKGSNGVSIDAEIDGDVVLDSEEFRIVEPIEGMVRLQRVTNGIFVEGEFDVTVEMTCARCLEPFEETFTCELRELFKPTIDILTGAIVHEQSGDGDFYIDDHHQLNITEAVRQNTILALPMQPLCSETCKGLCPMCGKNLNNEICNCAETPSEHWNALKSLTFDN